ncbi:MAG: sensor histidine kinase [Kiloniellaceae bacterium]
MSGEISRASLEVFPDPLLLVTPLGRVVAANRAAAEALRLPQGDPEVTLREIAGLAASELESLLRFCLATSAPVPLRLVFFTAGGAPLNTRCEGWRCEFGGQGAAVIRLCGDDEAATRFGELSRLVDELNRECMARRNSEGRLRRALVQLQDVNGIRDHMLAQVSHDLRTPLNAILGMTEFMKRQPFGPLGPKYAEYVDDIHVSGETLLELVDQVLHLAWDEARGREASSEALADLSECLENCRQVVEPIARMRGLEIMIPEDMALPRLRADHLLLKQILMNLLGNAAKYVPRGGHIEVVVEWRPGKDLAIQVHDDGPGISEEKLDAINHGALARSAYVTDVGFGLALSRRTASAIGARLDIQSAQGRGTIASLVLPHSLVEMDAAAP